MQNQSQQSQRNENSITDQRNGRSLQCSPGQSGLMKPALALARLRGIGAPTRNGTELPPIPMERIAQNALGHRKWSARDDLHVQGCLVLSQEGLLFLVNHAPGRNGL